MKKIPIKLIQNLSNEFWEMRAKFKKDISTPDDDTVFQFDYPDYYGLSYKVYSRLSGDFVDSLQGDFFGQMEAIGISEYKYFFKSKKDLHRHIVRIWKIYGLCD
jgi:hypothetical protein